MCTISVIVPVYNVEATIEKCLQSILDQTFSDIEIIVVNDGTKDNSMEIVQHYTTDKRIKIIEKKNNGLPQARKTGFLESHGKYIFFVDSDDWIEEKTLEYLYKAIQSQNADVACCNISIDYTNSQKSDSLIAEKNGELSHTKAISSIHNMSAVYQYAWNKLYRKDAIRPGDFPTGHFIGEDYCTIIPIIERATKIVQIKEVLYHYVQHENSMTKAGFGKPYLEAYQWYKNTRRNLLQKYPEQKTEILCYHVLQEMAILNSMYRNNIYEEQIKADLLADIKKNCRLYVLNRHTKPLYKVSAIVMSTNWKLYRSIYQAIYRRRNIYSEERSI